jgi:hypothetical protein
LSFAQERAWISDQLVRAGAAGSMGGAARLEGPLDEEALERSFEEIVCRHEVLRARFPRPGERRLLSVRDDAAGTWSVVDLRRLSGEAREAEVSRIARELAGRSFDLSEGPLFRTSLLRMGDREHVVVVTMHHSVGDAWSVGVFLRELQALYPAFARGKSSPLPPLPIQYADYAAWQRAWAEGSESAESIAYWKRQLRALPVLALPRDHSPPAVRTFRGGAVTFQLNPELSEALAALSRREGVTLFMTLLAAFQTLLHGVTGQEDIVVGSPVANRSRIETEGLIGCFMQPLVLRTDLSRDPSFRQLLQRTRDMCLGAYAHQDVPFELVARTVEPQWDGRHLPLFQVLFNLLREETMAVPLPGLTSTPLNLPSGASPLDLSVHLWVGGPEIRGVLEYSSELFERETIEWLGARYQNVLSSAVADPDLRLSVLSSAKPPEEGLSAERRELLALLLAENEETSMPDGPGRLFHRPRTGEPIPASFGLERLWFFEQMDPESALFNESAALLLEGPLRADVLARSWQELARRHETIRTSFVALDGHPWQVVATKVLLPLPQVDCTQLAKHERKRQMESLQDE